MVMALLLKQMAPVMAPGAAGGAGLCRTVWMGGTWIQGILLQLLLPSSHPRDILESCCHDGKQDTGHQLLLLEIPRGSATSRDFQSQLGSQLLMRWFKSGKSCLCARQLKLKVIKAKSFPARKVPNMWQ